MIDMDKDEDEEEEIIEPMAEEKITEEEKTGEKMEPSPEDMVGIWHWANQPDTFDGVTKDIPLANLKKESLWLVYELLSLGYIFGEYGAVDAKNYFCVEAQIKANVSVSEGALARKQITTVRQIQDITMKKEKKRRFGLPWK